MLHPRREGTAVGEASVHWTTIAAFWATVVVGLITVIATAINYYILRSQVDPDVIVYATSDKTRPTIIVIVIKNVGKGLATNVRFDFSEPLVVVFGIGDGTSNRRPIDSGPLIYGIPGLGPNAERLITWGQYGGLSSVYSDRTITVKVTYESEAIGIFGPEKHETVCYLDVRSFAGTDASDGRWDKHAADALKGIKSLLERVVSSSGAVRIEARQMSSDGEVTDT